MFKIDVLNYKNDFITIDKDGEGVRLKFKNFSKRFIGYTLEEALNIFKEDIKALAEGV